MFRPVPSPSQAGDQRPWHVFAAATGAFALVLAVVLRVAFLDRKSFWMDESWVASLAQLPVGELVATVPRTTAPLGFALAVKASSYIPGLAPEVSLRLLPLLAGIGVVVLLPRLVRALGGSPRAALLAMLISAAMPALVHYSRELKPYAVDALIAVAFPLVALRLITDPDSGGSPARRWLRRWSPTLFALAIPLFSYGAVFVLVATIAWGWIALWRRGASPARVPWAVATGAFLLLLALVGLTVIYRQVTLPNLTAFFRTRPLQEVPSLSSVAHHLSLALGTMARHQFPNGAAAALGLAAFGLVAWPAAGRGAAIGIFAGSLTLTAAAASSGLYAVKFGRLLLFGAPFLIAAVAVGLDRLLDLLVRPRALRAAGTLAAFGAVGALAAFWTYRDISHRLHPERTTWRTMFLYDNMRDTPAAAAELVRRWSAGDPLLVTRILKWPLQYYTRLPFTDVQEIPRDPVAARAALERWLPAVSGRGWVVLDTGKGTAPLVQVIESGGFSLVREDRFRGVVLWEISRNTAPDVAAP